jgi:chaperonin GroES
MLLALALSHLECRKFPKFPVEQSPVEVERMNLKPLGDRLIVEPLEEEQTTIGGIVLPDTALEKPQRGNVIAAGPGVRSQDTGEVIPMDVSEGDTVVFSKYGGTEIRIEGTDYLILRESDVLAKVVADRAPARAKVKA